MQFQKEVYACMRLCSEEVKNEEQTLELRLPDAMPDMGKILGAWGQVLIRSKEWRQGAAVLSGGVMTWVLYAPEDGSMARVVEGWVPFSMSWELPPSDRDGQLQVSCMLRSVDGRCLSARRLLVRTNLSAMVCAYLPSEFAVYSPEKLPQDVQLLQKSYPVCYPREAGEKPFQLDEDLTLSAELSGAKLMCCSLHPRVTDEKLMGDKAVFRGTAFFRALLRTPEGMLKSCTYELPFSQYAQLDQEYPDSASAQVMPIVTSLEPDILEDGKLRLKAGMSGQYMIYSRPVLQITEDAYSNCREIQLQTDLVNVPAVLEQQSRQVAISQSAAPMEELVDVTIYAQQPGVQRGPEESRITLSGSFSMLGRQEDGDLSGAVSRWEQELSVPTDSQTRLLVSCCPSGEVRSALTAEETVLGGEMMLNITTLSDYGIPQLSGVELGELREPDPMRPALVLCRAGEAELWDLARENGSTVDAIRRANHLQEAPVPGQMLLIPVM